MIDQDLWDQALSARERNKRSTHTNTPTGKRVWSLTGITHCWYCRGRIHTLYSNGKQPRMGCYNRAKGWECPQKSGVLSVYEHQVSEYLSTFEIPEDYQGRILEGHRKLQAAYHDTSQQRKRLEAQLQRAKELYEWGDFTRQEYQARREITQRQLRSLEPSSNGVDTLDRLAEFLKDVNAAWEAATQEQRNKLARSLFEEIWLQDKRVVAVKPRDEFEPFFRLNYEEFVKQNIEVATPTGFEPAISGLTGQYVKPLHHGAAVELGGGMLLGF